MQLLLKRKKKHPKKTEQPLDLMVCLVCPARAEKLFPIRQHEITGMQGWKVAFSFCTDCGWPSEKAWEWFYVRQSAGCEIPNGYTALKSFSCTM